MRSIHLVDISRGVERVQEVDVQVSDADSARHVLNAKLLPCIEMFRITYLDRFAKSATAQGLNRRATIFLHFKIVRALFFLHFFELPF